MNQIIIKLLGTFIRHGLTALGAYLVAKGALEQNVADQFASSGTEVVCGLLTVLVGLGLSALEKKTTLDKLTFGKK